MSVKVLFGPLICGVDLWFRDLNPWLLLRLFNWKALPISHLQATTRNQTGKGQHHVLLLVNLLFVLLALLSHGPRNLVPEPHPRGGVPKIGERLVSGWFLLGFPLNFKLTISFTNDRLKVVGELVSNLKARTDSSSYDVFTSIRLNCSPHVGPKGKLSLVEIYHYWKLPLVLKSPDEKQMEV